MKKTFYIATSFGNSGQAEELAGYLESKGMRWVYGHDWTKSTGTDQGDADASSKAQRDLQSAVAADVFILLLKSPLTVGCHSEMGARVTANKEAHLIRQGVEDWHLFHSHPGVIEHRDIDSFMRTVFSA